MASRRAIVVTKGLAGVRPVTQDSKALRKKFKSCPHSTRSATSAFREISARREDICSLKSCAG